MKIILFFNEQNTFNLFLTIFNFSHHTFKVYLLLKHSSLPPKNKYKQYKINHYQIRLFLSSLEILKKFELLLMQYVIPSNLLFRYITHSLKSCVHHHKIQDNEVKY